MTFFILCSSGSLGWEWDAIAHFSSSQTRRRAVLQKDIFPELLSKLDGKCNQILVGTEKDFHCLIPTEGQTAELRCQVSILGIPEAR